MWRPLIIAKREYIHHVKQKSFIGVLLLPLIVIVILAIILFVTLTAIEDATKGAIGVIDTTQALSGVFTNSSISITESRLENNTRQFMLFNDDESARQALMDYRIIAYFKLAPDFERSQKVELVYLEKAPDRTAIRAFEKLVKLAMLNSQQAKIAQRELDRIQIIFETPDKSRIFGGENSINWLIPIAIGILFLIAMFSGSQYLIQAVLEEKENRTIEMIVTTVSPWQFLSGKLIGLAAVGLTQIGVWLLAVLGLIYVLKRFILFLNNVSIDPAFIFIAIVMFLLQYLLFGSLMIAVGSTVANAKDGQGISSPFMLISLIPEFMLPLIFISPNNPIAVGLSVSPITSSLALLLRYAVTDIPAWQILIAIVLQGGAMLACLWIASRVFRLSMLRYGQRIRFDEILNSIR
jgi:ABC-2 type transport system permease protein